MNVTMDDYLKIIGELTIKTRVLESDLQKMVNLVNEQTKKIKELEDKFIPKVEESKPQLVEKK